MNSAKPKDLKVIDSSNYKFILYESFADRLFLTLTHESGFTAYSCTYELDACERDEIRKVRYEFIESLVGSFDHKSKKFSFFEAGREIEDFDSWEVNKLALKKWWGTNSGT